jgi:hypothetical protein
MTAESSLQGYDAVRIQTFLADRVDLASFCFVLEHVVSPQYAYRNLRGAIPAEKSQELVQTAIRNDDLGELVHQLAVYWLDRQHGNPRVLIRAEIHRDLIVYWRELRPAEVGGGAGVSQIQAQQNELRTRVRQCLVDHFDEEELKTLCADLGVDYESLPATGKAGKARELVALAERTSTIPVLVARCRQLRPNASCGDIPQSAGATPVPPTGDSFDRPRQDKAGQVLALLKRILPPEELQRVG